jgi:Tol biopolymer transport system component
MPDSRSVVFSDRPAPLTNSHLFSAGIDTDTDRVEQLTNGAGSEFTPSVAKNGGTIAFGAGSVDYDIVEIHLDGSVIDGIRSSVFEISPTSARGQTAYVAGGTGGPEIRLRTSEYASDRAIVTSGSFSEDPTFMLADTALAPDGRRVAFSRSGADEAIWVSTVTGDPPVRLAREPGDAFQRGPAWSPDGNQIAYFSTRKGRDVLMRARVGGFEPPDVVAEDAGSWPRWSPNGQWIATLNARGGGLILISPDGKVRKSVGTGEWLLHGWTGEGSTITGIKKTTKRTLAIAAVEVKSGTETTVAPLMALPAAFTYAGSPGAEPMRGFALSADGRSFRTSVIRATGDIWLMQRED